MGVSVIFLIVGILVRLFTFEPQVENSNKNQSNNNSLSTMGRIHLLEPQKEGQTSVEEAISTRRSVRHYKKGPLTLTDISQLVWASQGITDPASDKRATPSAGALHPIEIYVVVKNAEELEKGVYHYVVEEHTLEKTLDREVSQDLSQAALGQNSVADGAINLIIAGDPSVVAAKYGKRGERYTLMESGHVAQNVYLQAESLSLGTVVVGGFKEEGVKEVLDLPEKHNPYYIMPIGKK